MKRLIKDAGFLTLRPGLSSTQRSSTTVPIIQEIWHCVVKKSDRLLPRLHPLHTGTWRGILHTARANRGLSSSEGGHHNWHQLTQEEGEETGWCGRLVWVRRRLLRRMVTTRLRMFKCLPVQCPGWRSSARTCLTPPRSVVHASNACADALLAYGSSDLG